MTEQEAVEELARLYLAWKECPCNSEEEADLASMMADVYEEIGRDLQAGGWRASARLSKRNLNEQLADIRNQKLAP